MPVSHTLSDNNEQFANKDDKEGNSDEERENCKQFIHCDEKAHHPKYSNAQIVSFTPNVLWNITFTGKKRRTIYFPEKNLERWHMKFDESDQTRLKQFKNGFS